MHSWRWHVNHRAIIDSPAHLSAEAVSPAGWLTCINQGSTCLSSSTPHKTLSTDTCLRTRYSRFQDAQLLLVLPHHQCISFIKGIQLLLSRIFCYCTVAFLISRYFCLSIFKVKYTQLGTTILIISFFGNRPYKPTYLQKSI